MDLQKAAAAWGITLSPDQMQQYDRYYRLLVEWNERFNLTALTARDEVYAKHFLDSLAGLGFMHGKVCDVGAGAGFPSLALAIADKSVDYTLLDSVNKKVNFLLAVKDELHLDNTRPVHVRAEDAGRGQMRETFDVVTARAVAPIGTLLEYLCPLAKVGGQVVVYKTNAVEERALASRAVGVFKLEEIACFEYEIEEAKRCVLVYRKTAATPRQYPRGGNKPRTMPL